jgi:hypothetical protein
MATRMIVTSQPDVACDVCGRRLLRGEQPDVFLAGGRRRTVCELCAPRASAEGWVRETDHRAVSPPPPRPRRGRNLLERLRQQRERVQSPGETMFAVAGVPEDPDGASYDFFDARSPTAEPSVSGEIASDLGQAARPVPAVPFAGAGGVSAEEAPTGGDTQADGNAQTVRALEVFNASEHPRRVAGVARSLGAPSVSVRPPAETGSTVVAIVVAWELSWYRYEVDLADEAARASVAAQGTELSELAAEDRLGNAVAAADGSLSLVASVPR